MSRTTTNAYKLALNSLHYTGMARLLRGMFSGVGAILTLHHVSPSHPTGPFAPNSILDIDPGFLEEAIVLMRRSGHDFVSLDEFHRRMSTRDFNRRFVCFTIDDGYRDNYEHAFPVFARQQVPFAIYVCTGLMNGTANLWWRDLEAVIAGLDHLQVPATNGGPEERATDTDEARDRVFNDLYWSIRAMPLAAQLEFTEQLLTLNPCPIDTSHEAPLTWDMLAEMRDSGLLTIGAHTVNHYALSKLTDAALRTELDASRAEIEARCGIRPEHFAYPYGDAGSAARREFEVAAGLGFATAVTTRKGVIFPEHANHLHALPRISLNGAYQALKYVDLFLTGLPFALHNRFRKCNVN
jgi:peptidoglycan/xylan/chitin deacetylase (PgdA/CDA1 family)